MNRVARPVVLGTLALVSASLVALEVLLTRLLSVTTWYGHAFLALSLAMLGLTRGSLDASAARDAGEPLGPWVGARMVRFAVGLMVATLVAVSTPLSLTPDLSSFGAVLLVAGAATYPMVASGGVVARWLAESDAPLSLLYGVDLFAAAVGALLPLVLLGPLSAPAALFLLAAVVAAGALALLPRGRRALAVTVCGVALAVVGLTRFTHAGLELRYIKGVARPANVRPLYEAWNPLSHVAVTPYTVGPMPLWSAPPRVQPPLAAYASAYIDGEAGTVVLGYRDLAQLEGLRMDATTSAHALRPDGLACVIGIGGGRDILAALLFGHDQVIGAEINPALVDMLHSVARYNPVLSDPRVHVAVGDGRVIFAHTPVHCRVLQASLVDTWAATGAGAFAHAEATLYTREAWSIFLTRTEPDGVLTFSRWYDPTRVSETARLLALALASLRDRGVSHPRDHIALLAAGSVATILVSPAPLTPADLDALDGLTSRHGFEQVVRPGRPAREPLLEALLAAPTVDDLARAGVPYGMDTSAPTDDRPFFFQLLAARAWLHPFATARAAMHSTGVLAGNVVAALELLMTFFAVVLIGVALLGPTLVRAAREKVPPLPGWRAGAYFGALGAGFMLAEVALVQRMHVALGHPTYSLIVVLAGLLVATGIGSALSPRVLRSRRAVSAFAVVSAVVLAVIPYAVITPVAHATLAAPFAVRVLWTGGCAALLGLCLGMLFPAGLRYVARARGAPVALAVNGVTSVLGSVAAIAVSVWAGISVTFVLAGAVYLVAAAAGPHGWREVEDPPTPG